MRLRHFICLLFAFIHIVALPVDAKLALGSDNFSRLPDVTKVKLSPDGSKLFSLVRIRADDKEGNGSALIVRDFNKKEPKILLTTSNEKFVIRWVEWAGNDALLVSVIYPARVYLTTPVSATRLLRLDVNTAEAKSAIPQKIINRADFIPINQDRVVDFLPDSPDEIIVSLRLSNRVGSEVYRINHKENKSKRIKRYQPKTFFWQTDRQHNLRIYSWLDGKQTGYKYRRVNKSKWETLFEYEALSEARKVPIGFDQDPNKFYYQSIHKGRDAVFLGDLSTTPMKSELILSNENYDVNAQLVYSNRLKKLLV